MPRYLIRHPAGKQREDALLEDPVLTLRFKGGWAVFEDADGICLAIPRRKAPASSGWTSRRSLCRRRSSAR